MAKRTILTGLIALVLCGLCHDAVASVVGKITGTVTDAVSNQAVAGATVAVKNTRMGAIAAPDGSYTIMNVPAGTYTLVVSAVGYSTLEIDSVRVSPDLASYQDPHLQAATTDLKTTIRVVAQTPLVTKDKTTAINVVQRDELVRLPTRGFEQVVGIQNSVVRMNAGNFGQRQRGQREAQSGSQELNLRGGRPSEVAYYVDGFSQQDPLTGQSSARISNNAIQEVSVISGAFSAEYGHVASGIVNVITNEGSEKYHGNVEAVTDNALRDNFDNNYYSADFSGPIPGMDHAYFFVSGERRYLGDRTPSAKTEEMMNTVGRAFGLDTRYHDAPQRLPMNSLKGWSFQGKLRFDLNARTKLYFSGNGSVDDWREYRQEWLLNPMHGPRYQDKNLGLNAKINQVLNDKTYYNFSVSYFMTSRIRGDAQIFDDYRAYQRSYTWDDGQVDEIPNPEYDDFSLFWTPTEGITLQNVDTLGWKLNWYDTTVVGTDTTFSNLKDSVVIDTTRYVTVDRTSYYVGFLKRTSSYIGVKGDITSQVHPYHTLKAGFDFQRHTLRFFQNLNATQGYNPEQNDRVNRYGYDEFAEEADIDNDINGTKHPYNLGLYAQDRFEWGGLVVQGGLRYDLFDYQTKRVKDIKLPFGNDKTTLDPQDLEDSKIFSRVSPRLGISFPISPSTQMHINYGKFYQRPDLNRLYAGLDFFAARVTSGSYYPFPSPNLGPEKTTQYEVGLTHQLGENVAFDVTAYYKDVQDLTQILHVAAVPKAYDIFANIDYGTIKGVDFALNMRRTQNIRIDLKYSLSYATGTGSYAQSTYSLNWFAGNPPKTTSPLDYDQRHNVNCIIDYQLGRKKGPRTGDVFPLENLSLNVIVSAGSGTPFTPSQIYDEATENAVRPLPSGKVNSANKPWVFNIDFKLERAFDIGGGYQLIPYVWVKNLLDRANVIGVYEGTGKPDVTGYLATDQGRRAISDSQAQGTDYKERYELKQLNPTNYSNPRMVFFGMRASF